MEEKHPGDTGCEYYKSCLTCPFLECKEYGVRQFIMAKKLQEVKELWQKGMNRKEIAETLKVGEKTVGRRLNQLGLHRKKKQ